MIIKYASMFLCALFVIFLPAASLFGAQHVEDQVIESITVKVMNLPDDSSFDMDAVKSRMRTKEGDVFTHADFDNDLKTLVQEFDRVEPEVTLVNDKVRILLKIWPKPTIRTITWLGNDKVKSKRLMKELGIALCTVFDRCEFNRAFQKLRAYYIRKGFFEAQLKYEIKLDPLTNCIDIDVIIEEGRSGKIREIVFENFTKREEDELNELLVTKTYFIFTSWLTHEGTFNEEAMQHDQLQILNYLQNKGFADARVHVKVTEAEQCDRIIITITAERGPLYTAGKLTFAGNTVFCDEDIIKMFWIQEGAPFSPEKVRDTVQRITHLYGRKGYIDANVNFQPRLEKGQCVYSIDFTIEEGEQYKVGLIKVLGNCSTQTRVILHETLLIPGETFNVDKLERTEERLMNIGYFKNVNVYAVKTNGPDSLGGCYRDVQIEVEETSTGRVGASLGYSTVESLFGTLSLTENNFNWKGLFTCWRDGPGALRGAGEFLNLTTTIGVHSRSYGISYTKPYFFDTPWVAGFDIERSNNRYISEDYEINSLGFTLRTSRMLNAFVRLGFHYRYRNSQVKVSQHRKALHSLNKDGGAISGVGSLLQYDSTNHPQEPTKGFKSRLEAEYVGVGGDSTFWGFAYLNSYYIKISETAVFKIRGDIRFLTPFGETDYNNMPLDERLFLGADTAPRGYRPYRLGPHFKGFKDDPSGGLSLQVYSLEYKQKLFKKVEGFVFFDAGFVSKHEWRIGQPFTSVGFGFRVGLLPGMAPVCFGMGFPIHPGDRSRVKKFFLTAGGSF